MAPHATETPQEIASLTKMKTRVEATSDTTGVTVPDPITQVKPTRPRFSHNDVIPHRQTSKVSMAKGVAPFSSAEMFKSSTALDKPRASKSFYESHLTAETKMRKPSSLKGAMKFFTPETISLCGGLPSSDYFPFEELAFQVSQSPSFLPGQVNTVKARKHDIQEGKSDFDLSVCLNYGQSMGPPQLMRFLTEHTEIVHAPPYSNWEIAMTQGSTSALDILFRMFCNKGDALLTEEYSFSSAIETALPMGLVPVGIKMDAKGMCPKDLEYVLSNWIEGDCLSQRKYGGAPRPRVMYIVPTGQNPTGATQDLQRRKDILAICEKYDVLILEDEPYYFLQMDDYVWKSQQGQNGAQNAETPSDLATFLDALVPSYLSLATMGNVIRIDSFSKIIAPGSRTGWITGPAELVERFIRASEVSAQNPSGFSMMALFKLLEEEWGHEGFLKWLQFLRREYSSRRDGIVAACEDHLPTAIVKFDAPMAGMFHWLRVDGSKHPVWVEKSQNLTTEAEKEALLLDIEEQIFRAAAANHVLVARGSWFRAEKDNHFQPAMNGHTTNGDVEVPAQKDFNTFMYFRMTFAAAPEDKIAEAVRRFGETLRVEFKA